MRAGGTAEGKRERNGVTMWWIDRLRRSRSKELGTTEGQAPNLPALTTPPGVTAGGCASITSSAPATARSITSSFKPPTSRAADARLLLSTHERHVIQTVLYLGREPLRLEDGDQSPSMDFRYEIVNLREYDAEPLLASDDWADVALALLAKGDREKALAVAVSRLVEMERGARVGLGYGPGSVDFAAV